MKKKATAVEKVAIKAKRSPRPKKAPAILVTEAHPFWTVHGVCIASLPELADALAVMERRVYQYHADKDYLDFAVWVERVLGDKKCASLLKKAATAKEAERAIRGHLATHYQV